MEMQQVRYFIAVAETLNFSRAAERCNVSQPALTRAIQLLEAELGGELIRRERSLSHLTELGARMLPLIRQCYDGANAAKLLARSVEKGEISPISVALSRTVNVALLLPVIRELSRAFPGLQLTVRRGSRAEIAEFLKSGEVDMAVAGPLGESWERLDAFSLFDEPLVLLYSGEHKFSNRDAIDFRELLAERFLVCTDCEMAEQVSERFKAAGVTEPASHEVANESDLAAFLEANLGIAVTAASNARGGKLRRVPLKGFDLTRTVSVYSVAGRRRGKVGSTLLNMLRAAQWPTQGVNGKASGIH